MKNTKEGFTPIPVPPSRACGICRNRMNQVCLEVCAPKESYEYFDPDSNRPLGNMPKLTFNEYLELPGSMKGKWLFVQQTKIQEAFNGDEIRGNIYGARSGRLSKNEQVKGLLPDTTERTPPYQDWEEREDKGEGSKKMD
jgi:hypothetical protein